MDFDLSMLGVISDEVLFNICEYMDNPTLLNFVQTYGRAYQVCNSILIERYSHLDKLATSIILTSNVAYFFGKLDHRAIGYQIIDLNVPAESYVIISGGDTIVVTQIYNQPGTPWLFQRLLEVSESMERSSILGHLTKKGFVEGYYSTTLELTEREVIRQLILELLIILHQNGFVLKLIEELDVE